MGRIKTNKEYTIKLIHPEFGEYYLYYIRNNSYGNGISYIFTKNLNKVLTWKTIKYVEEEMKSIKDRLSNVTGDILLSFGENVNEELKPRLIYSRKKYFFKVSFATSHALMEEAQNNINSLNISLLTDSELIFETIKNGMHFEKEFSKIIKNLDSQISKYRTEYFFLEKSKTNGVFVDIVDASYNFRFLKLKNLNNLSDNEQ